MVSSAVSPMESGLCLVDDSSLPAAMLAARRLFQDWYSGQPQHGTRRLHWPGLFGEVVLRAHMCSGSTYDISMTPVQVTRS